MQVVRRTLSQSQNAAGMPTPCSVGLASRSSHCLRRWDALTCVSVSPAAGASAARHSCCISPVHCLVTYSVRTRTQQTHSF